MPGAGGDGVLAPDMGHGCLRLKANSSRHRSSSVPIQETEIEIVRWGWAVLLGAGGEAEEQVGANLLSPGPATPLAESTVYKLLTQGKLPGMKVGALAFFAQAVG